MNISVLLIIFSSLHLFAANSYSLSTHLTLNMEQVKIKDVLIQIENQSEFHFLYNGKLVDVDKTVCIKVDNQPITDVLAQLFDNNDVTFKIVDRQIVLLPSSLQENFTTVPEPKFQDIAINGTVKDNQGYPLPGVNIMIKGTSIGVISDIDGRFSITVPGRDAILVFSYIGFITQESPASNPNINNITLHEDTQSLDEVVVVGYGVQRKVNLTGSVSSVNFDEEMLNRPLTDASQALSGKISGIWVSQNSGKPGSDGAQLRVRGWGTLNNAEPLVIIDGVQGDFNTLNPNDIESISVLKDAASAAIYGSKAANGVILITTKTGSRNERTEVTFTSYAGVQTLGRKFELVNNSAEFMRIANQAIINNGGSQHYPDYLIQAFENGTDKYKYPNTDWFKQMYEPAFMYNGNFSIRGGTQKSSSFLSFSYQNQEGMVPHTSSYRYGMRANLEYDVNTWLVVGGRFNYMRRVSDEPFDLDRTLTNFQGSPPFIAPYDRLGRFGSSEAINDRGTQLYDNMNPLIDAANGNTKRTDNTLTADAFLRIKFTKDLILNATWSSGGRWVMTDQYNTPEFGYTDAGMETQTRNYNREGLMMIRDFSNISMTNNVYATLNYNKKFAGAHDIAVVAGFQLEDFNRKNVYARRTEPPVPGLTQVDAGTSGVQAEGNMVGLRMFSYFGRFNYALYSKYLFEANFRADASSRFREGHRWGYFPGFSIGWRLSEENMIKDLGLFSNLKLRASWGQLGNQNISGYWPYLAVIAQNYTLSHNWGGSLAPGAAVTAMVDPDITWETSTTTNLGIDVGFLDNRLTIEADYFNKTTTDILVQLPIPLVLGGKTAAFENVGEMLNRGVEFTINYDNKQLNNNQFGYNLAFNFTYIHNEVTKFRKDAPDQLYLIREGYPYRTLYGYKVVGIYQSDEEAKNHMHSNSFVPKAGDLKIEDVNNDGKQDYQDKQELGNTIPKITYGLTANFSYKNFDLNLLFQGTALGHLYTQSTFANLIYQQQSITVKWRDAWTPENTNTKIPAVRWDSAWNQSENSFWVHRSDFLKLKNIQLGYMLPRSIASKIGMNKLYVYANAQNVFTMMMFKGYEGYDPERTYNSSGGSIYPAARIISLGFNITF